jgi:toxin ParE1/3/4
VKRLRLTPEAELDLDEAYSWYQAQRPGLAADFLAAVGTCIASIRRRPEAYQLVDPTMRRALLLCSVPLRQEPPRLEAQT